MLKKTSSALAVAAITFALAAPAAPASTHPNRSTNHIVKKHKRVKAVSSAVVCRTRAC